MQSEYIISVEQSNRLNILKLLMALFVIYIHNNISEINFSSETVTLMTPQWFILFKYTISALIPRFAVPCFFLMASFFLYRKDFKWKDNIIKKCKSLLVPYFIMNTVWIVIFAVCQSIPQTAVFFGNADNMVAEFSVYRWFQAYGIGAEYPFLFPLWFLRNLFILNLLAPVIKFLIDRFPKVSTVTIIALYFLLPTTNCFYLQIDDLSMWCFGYLIAKYKVDMNRFDNNKCIPIIYSVTIIMCLILKDFNIAVLSTALQRFSFIISIIFWYSCFTKNFNGALQRLFNRYSKYNFGIYIFHEFALGFAIKFVAKVIGTNIYIQVIEYLFLPLIIAAFVIALCMILERVAPKTLSLLTGARVQ